MSTVTLRELAVHNEHPLLAISTINMNSMEDDSVRSSPNFGSDRNLLVLEHVPAVDSLRDFLLAIVRLPFVSRSSPRLFDCLSIAVEWIISISWMIF